VCGSQITKLLHFLSNKLDVNILTRFRAPAALQTARLASWLHAEPLSRRSEASDAAPIDDTSHIIASSEAIDDEFGIATPSTAAHNNHNNSSSSTASTFGGTNLSTSGLASSAPLQQSSAQQHHINPALVIPTPVQHPGIARVLHVYESEQYVYFVFRHVGLTLKDLFTFSPLLNDCKAWRLFAAYQLLQAVHHLHSSGVAHGNLSPASITTTPLGWLGLSFFHPIPHAASASPSVSPSASPASPASTLPTTPTRSDTVAPSSAEETQARPGTIPQSPSLPSPSSEGPLDTTSSTSSVFMRWLRHEISNFEYLMHLNHLAGRRVGDPNFCPVMPWIINFSRDPDAMVLTTPLPAAPSHNTGPLSSREVAELEEWGWRDFTRTKFRLTKGMTPKERGRHTALTRS